jgi:phenylpyruvate tautomerase PptA (4-oxalocrotonate tautomerase family)
VPLVRISHRALVDTIGVPELDRFQILSEHEPGDLVYDPGFLGIARSNDIVIIQITISAGRTLTQKRALFARIADNLAALGLRREDAWINLVEAAKENWSFGLGEASYAPAEKKLPA